MKKFASLVLTVVILFATALFCLPAAAASGCYVAADSTVEITGSKEYSSFSIYGTLVVKAGAVVTVEDINLNKGGTLEIEEGATLKLDGGCFYHRGNFILNGTFKGSSEYFSASAPLTIGEHGLLAVSVADANTASSVAGALRTCGAPNATNYGITVMASSATHTHTYDANGICTGCGISGCLFGISPHTYEGGVCTGCGKSETVTITGKQTYYSLSVTDNTIIKTGAEISLRSIDIAKGAKLTIEKGAVVTLQQSSGDIYARGDIILNGMLVGDISNLNISGSFTLGDGAYMVLNVTKSGSLYSVTRQLQSCGVAFSAFGDTLIAGNGEHAHSYNEKGVCTRCGVYGCRIGEYSHIYQNGVCIGCGTIGCKIGECEHTYQNGVCKMCGAVGCKIGELAHTYKDGVCTLCGAVGCKIGELAHTYKDYVCTLCGAVNLHHPHRYAAGVCTICGYKCNHYFDKYGSGEERYTCGTCGITKCELKGSHSYSNGKCTVCGAVCQNDFHNGSYACPECNMRLNPSITGSVLSEGSLTIVCTVAAAGVFGLGGVFFGRSMKKKKKKPTAEDEE